MNVASCNVKQNVVAEKRATQISDQKLTLNRTSFQARSKGMLWNSTLAVFFTNSLWFDNMGA